MSRPAPEIQLSTEEKETLLHWMRSTKTERRMVERARIILLAANGLNGEEIAARMETRTARVSKWLRRFAKDRIAGLLDAPRPGEKRRKYNPATEERILKALDEPPPAGYSRWNGTRWYSVSMRSPAFKPSSGRRAGFACLTVERSLALHTNTSAMAPARSLRPWRWPLGWCMQGIIGAGAGANFWIS